MIDDRQAIITTQTSERGSKHAVFQTVKYLPEMISIENSKGEKKHKELNMLQYASRKVISPCGANTPALRLTSELVDLRVGYAKRIRRAEARRVAFLPTP